MLHTTRTLRRSLNHCGFVALSVLLIAAFIPVTSRGFAESATPSVALNLPPTPGAGDVVAAGETDPVPHGGDAADDPAIWIHPTNPRLSTVIGTDKLGGLAVYDLAGNQLAYYADGAPNNVDLRYNFPLSGQRVALVVTSDRPSDSLRVYRVDPKSRGLDYVAARTLSTGIGVAGLCLYVSPSSGKYYAFVSDSSGTVQQWELYDNGSGKVDATKVLRISLGSTTEGCVADDVSGSLYISEEDVGIWQYGAEPDAGSSRAMIASVGEKLTADIEGLAIYYGGGGYLIASSQGSNDFAIFTRSGSFVGRFMVKDGTVDAVSYTDGLDVTNVNLGGAFNSGLFVAQDDDNDGGHQNFKLVPWDQIARSFSPALAIDTSFDPRAIGGDNSSPTPNPLPSPTKTPAPSPAPTNIAPPTFIPTPTSISASTPSPALPSGARTFYVDSTSGNDANAGSSSSTAWRTLNKASAAQLEPGDRLLFRRGASWTGTLKIDESGSRNSPIIVGAYGSGGDLPVFSRGCLDLAGSSIVVQEIKTAGCSFAGVAVSGDNNRIERSELTTSVAGVYVRSGAAFTRILKNRIINNNVMSVNDPGGEGDSGAFGILIHGDQTEVAFNTISGSDAFSYDYGRDGAAIEIYGGRNSHIHHNVAVDNDAFAELGDSRSADNIFAYNLVRSSLATSVGIVTRGGESSRGPVVGTRLYNNTIVLTGDKSQGFVCYSGCGPDILTMRNNIVQAVGKSGYADAAFDEDYNLFFGGQLQFTRGGHSLVDDPRFDSGTFLLTARSPAIDYGRAVGYDEDLNRAPVPVDGNGDGRAAPDLGAYEYQG